MKISFLIFTLLFTFKSFSCIHHNGDLIHCNSEMINDSNASTPFASDDLCSDDRYLQEAKAQYDSYPKSTRIITKKLKGKKIRGTKKELSFLGQMIGGGWRDQKKVLEAVEKCNEVFCVLENALGSKESAYRALNIAYRSSYATSLKSQSNADYIWSKEELRNLNYSVNVMPDHMLNSKTMGKFYVLPNNAYPGGKRYVGGLAGPGPNKTGDILYTDHIRKNAGSSAAHIMIHEMIHQYDNDNFFKTGEHRSDVGGYCKQNGWQKEVKVEVKDGIHYESDVWTAEKDKACYFTNYASKRPREDFAEAVTYYMIDPDGLKKKCPKNYDFLKKNHFKGKEYTQSDFNQNLEQYIVDNAINFKECLEPELTSVSIGKKLEFIKKYKNSNMFQTHGTVKTKISDQCLADVVEVANGFFPDDPLACTNKRVPHNIKSKIKSLFNKHFNEQLNEDIKNVFSESSLSKFSKACYEQKDLRSSCIKNKANEVIANLGYGFDALSEIQLNSNAKYEKYFPMPKDSYALISESVYDYSQNLKTLIDDPKWTKAYVRKELEKDILAQGYQLDKKSMAPMENFVNSKSLSKIMKTTKEKVLSKNLSDYKSGCSLIKQSKCVKGKIKEIYIAENPSENNESLARFIDIIYDYMKTFQ